MVTMTAGQLAAIVVASVLCGSVISTFVIALCSVAKDEDNNYEILSNKEET